MSDTHALVGARSVAPAAMRPFALAAGVATIAVALCPPVDAATTTSLTMHMTQHVLLLTVAPPLLVLGLARGTTSAKWLAFAVVVHSAVLLGWHAPVVYDAANRHLPIHVAEHLSMVLAGVTLWWSAGIGNRTVRPSSLVALFVAAFPGIALGSAMTLSTQTWFARYPDVSDQQVAGAVMWAAGGAVYALAAGAATVAWLRQEDV